MKSPLFFALICSISLSNQMLHAAHQNPLEAIKNHESNPERLYMALIVTQKIWTKLLSSQRFEIVPQTEVPDIVEEPTDINEILAMQDEVGTIQDSEEDPEEVPQDALLLASAVRRYRAFNGVCQLWDTIPRLQSSRIKLQETFVAYYNQPACTPERALYVFCCHALLFLGKVINNIAPERRHELNQRCSEIESALYEYVPSSTTF